MMDHIRQRDWCQRRTSEDFVDEADIDNCVIERIIRNKFWDPLISSDDEEPVRGPIDWSSVFKKKKMFEEKQHRYRIFVPGLRNIPPQPKLSALAKEDHRQCLKVICAINKSILPREFLGRPIKSDYTAFENTAEIYAKEQKEYIQWAKALWVTTNCVRALRPKPLIEMIYDAEFKMKAQRLQFYAKKYTLAAQIPLKADSHKCDIILPQEDLIQVNMADIPEVLYPKMNEERVSILHACSMPEPCDQHPCKFKLPNESTESLLPMREIHKELAQFALDNGADFIASENALKCLLETDRVWTVPCSVCEVIGADGETSNVVVLGTDFPLKKDFAPMRTYMAYKHLLLNAFTGKTGRTRTFTDKSDNSVTDAQNIKNHSNNTSRSSRSRKSSTEQKPKDLTDRDPARKNKSVPSDSHKAAHVYNDTWRKIILNQDLSDSENEDRLQICLDDDECKSEGIQIAAESDQPKETSNFDTDRSSPDESVTSPPRKILKARPRKSPNQEEQNEMGLFDCACKDSDFEISPPRSYKNWQIKNYTTKENVNIIIHCSHTLQNKQKNEVILEPIVEYQLDVGGTLQSPQKLQSLALSMMLRKNTELINARVDALSGELVTIDTFNLTEFAAIHGDFREDIANGICTTLNQLAGLLPGEYLLRHEPHHGCNAILFSSKWSLGLETLQVEWENSQVDVTQEAKLVETPPLLGPVLLPVHKFRRHLPLAFTWDERHVMKESAKATARKKIPPAAIQWPKRKRRNSKKKRN